MCILTFFPPGATPNLDALADGAIANPHGHGYAVLADDALVVGHGLDPATVITEFAAVRAEFPDTPALFHSRLATHGRVSADNCHPFALGGDERTVLAHNGILPATVHPTLGDPRSDTRIAAEDYLPSAPFGSLDSWTGRAGIEHWLGTDKMVLLTVDPAYRQRAYLFNEHHGHWHKGIWYSNHSYRWASAGFDYTDIDYCLNCGEFEPEWFGAHCTFCGFCQDCLAEYPDCQCPPFEGTADRYADLQYPSTPTTPRPPDRHPGKGLPRVLHRLPQATADAELLRQVPDGIDARFRDDTNLGDLDHASARSTP